MMSPTEQSPGENVKEFVKALILKAQRGLPLEVSLDSINLEMGISKPYQALRFIYQLFTDVMLREGKPLIDVCVYISNFSSKASSTNHHCPNPNVQSLEINPIADWPIQKFKQVGIGGTFDRLHAGHKLMLSVAALLTKDRVVCGVTDDLMLNPKKFLDRLESWERRSQRVRDFLQAFSPVDLNVDVVRITDPFGPTITNTKLEALVVSPETLSGVNEQRSRNGLQPLELVVVDLISIDYPEWSEGKLSSTLLRFLDDK